MYVTRCPSLRTSGRIVLIACLTASLNAPRTTAAGRPVRPAQTTSAVLVPGTVYTLGGVNRAGLVEQHITEAYKLEKAGKIDAAEARFVEALRLDPRNARIYGLQRLYFPNHDNRPVRGSEAYLIAAIGKYYEARYNSAIKTLDQVARAYPKGVPADLLLPVRVELFTYWGLAKAAIGDRAGAMAEFDTAAAVDPTSPRPHVARAEVLAAANDLVGALASYERAVGRAPDAPTPYFSRGLMYLEGGHPEAALKDLNRVVELLPESYDAWLARGMTLAKLGRGGDALADFEVALRLEPSNDNLFAERARAHHVKGDLAEARADCETAIGLNPDNARAYLHRGLVENAQKRLAPAFEDLAQAVRLSHKSVPPALSLAEAIMKARPALPEPYHLRGLVRLRATDQLEGDAKTAALAEARSDLERYFELGGTSSAGYYDLGLCMAQLGRHEAALEAYAKVGRPGEKLARGINPYLASAYSLHALKRYEDAAKQCDAAIGAEPQNGQAYKWRGLVRLSLSPDDQRPPALDDLARADELIGYKDPEVWYLSALAHLEAARVSVDHDQRVAHLERARTENFNSGDWNRQRLPHHEQLHHYASALLYYAGGLGERTPESDRFYAQAGIAPSPEALKPGERAAAAPPEQDGPKKVEEDKTGTYVLLGIGALLLANELLRDQDPAATTANERPRPKRTFPCPDCGGSGEATVEGHRVFNNVPAPSLNFGPCLRCDGIGKLPPLW